MALSSTVINAEIMAAGADLKGSVWLQLAQAISLAVASWAVVPTNVLISGVTAGTAGGGKVDGSLFVTPQPLPVSLAASGAKLLGMHTPGITKAVGIGVANGFNKSAMYSGVSAGVGVGTDVVTSVTAQGAVLTQILMGFAQGMGLKGVEMPDLANALGTGIADLIANGTRGAGAVTGSASPTAASGTSTSWVV